MQRTDSGTSALHFNIANNQYQISKEEIFFGWTAKMEAFSTESILGNIWRIKQSYWEIWWENWLHFLQVVHLASEEISGEYQRQQIRSFFLILKVKPILIFLLLFKKGKNKIYIDILPPMPGVFLKKWKISLSSDVTFIAGVSLTVNFSQVKFQSSYCNWQI